MFAPRRSVRTARRDGRAGRGQGDPDGQPRQAVGHRAQVRRVTTRPVQPGDGWRQPAQADAVATRAQRRRQRPSGGVCRCGAKLLGRRPVPAQRRGLLPALHQVRRDRTAAVHQHGSAGATDSRGGAEPDPPRPGVRSLSRAEAVHDPRRRSVVGHRDPPDDQIPEPAVDDVGLVAQAATRQPAALHAHPRQEQGDLRIRLAGAANAARGARGARAGSARRRAGQLSLQQRTANSSSENRKH